MKINPATGLPTDYDRERGHRVDPEEEYDKDDPRSQGLPPYYDEPDDDDYVDDDPYPDEWEPFEDEDDLDDDLEDE